MVCIRGRLQAALYFPSRRAVRRRHAPSTLPRRLRLMLTPPPQHPPSNSRAPIEPPHQQCAPSQKHSTLQQHHHTTPTPRPESHAARAPTFTHVLQFQYTRCDVPFPSGSQLFKHGKYSFSYQIDSFSVVQNTAPSHQSYTQSPAPGPPASARDPHPQLFRPPRSLTPPPFRPRPSVPHNPFPLPSPLPQ